MPNVIARLSAVATTWFASIIIVTSLVAYLVPGLFQFVLPWIPWLLGIIMLGMGLTLRLEDFRMVLTQPRAVAAGVSLQFIIMPLLGWLLAKGLQLPPEIAAGLILLGACPGGTASNVITYIGKGDVALSVTMTAISTLLSPLLTPWITLALAGTWMEISPSALFTSIVCMVLLPVLLGIGLSHFLPDLCARAKAGLPLISIIAIVLIVGAVIGANANRLTGAAIPAIAAVILHNAGGLAIAWWLSGWLRLNTSRRRAVTIEVGMQNSGLAVALATAHMGPMAALPGALFSVWHNITGPWLASRWARSDSNRKLSD